tara:strand:+ start:939 stop:2240 length:1302 start_codon:yes stop_codon:yes gene_type:complete
MKFFEFIRGEVNESSIRASDTGAGLSVIVVPASSLAFMTATKGSVNLTFNNCSIYEDAALFDGEAVEKTNIQISCLNGKEIELIDDITRFITSKTIKQVMKFDVRKQGSTFNNAEINNIDDVISKVTINPVIMSSGKKSKGDPEKEYQRSIAGIDFGEDLPSLDYNHEGLAIYADGDEITAWANAGTGGTTYSIASNVADPKCELTFRVSGIGKASAQINLDDYFVVPNSYTVRGDYTIYMAVSITASTDGTGVIYGDDSGDTMGFCFGNAAYDASGGIDKANGTISTFKIRHDARTGEPASVSTNNTDNGTVSYDFPENYFDEDQGETCHVFVIRRDEHSNMYMHNRTGELVGFIPKFTVLDTITGNETSIDGMTDGNLLIQQLGSGGGIVATSGTNQSFKGYLARFGVIEKDIGTNNAATLAQDLFNLYNF